MAQRRARRAGRDARLARRASPRARGPISRAIPLYRLIDEEGLAAMEAQANWILREIGVEFRNDPTALALFKDAGCDVRGEKARFPEGLAEALCKKAPSTFQLHGRDPARTATLGGERAVFMPGYGSPFVSDLEGGRRYAAFRDFVNFVKLAQTSPYLQHVGGVVCEPVDLPVETRHLDMTRAQLRYATKPFMGPVTAPERARDGIAMAKLVFGADFMAKNTVMQANINANSPLVYDGTMTEALRIYAEEGQAVAISPAVFAGAMGPVTRAAVAAQTHAEWMAGIALAQLARPGCPVVHGSFHSTMNLRSGALTFGSRDAYLEVGPGENFSSCGHTLRHFESANYEPAPPEPGSFEQWRDKGRKTTEQRAYDLWRAQLERYEAPALDQAIGEALDAFTARRKEAAA